MIMKKIILVFFAFLMSAGVASAQDYKYGIGLRLSTISSKPIIDFKWNPNSTNSWEFNLGFSTFNDDVAATVAYEWNWGFGDTGFNAYIGPQATVGIAKYNKNFTFGVGALGGIEYRFDSPLAVGIDWKPTFAFSQGQLDTWGIRDVAIAVRYTF
jgi:hypothetical protein